MCLTQDIYALIWRDIFKKIPKHNHVVDLKLRIGFSALVWFGSVLGMSKETKPKKLFLEKY